VLREAHWVVVVEARASLLEVNVLSCVQFEHWVPGEVSLQVLHEVRGGTHVTEVAVVEIESHCEQLGTRDGLCVSVE
jgi:hypothetical protein